MKSHFLHMLLHAAEWHVFGTQVRGYHVVNVILHALVSWLLVLLLLTSRIPPSAALLGGSFFLLHPANVEAVAWISQLKTTSAMALALGALLAHPRRPALGALLFAQIEIQRQRTRPSRAQSRSTTTGSAKAASGFANSARANIISERFREASARLTE